jgi:serine/threonine protein kinase
MVIIGNKYEIENMIGKGTFGKIYKGNNIRTKEDVAIKMEEWTDSKSFNSLKYETQIYQYLNNSIGIPNLKWYGTYNNYRYIVLELLGDNLVDSKLKNGVFSPIKTMEIGLNALNILENIHQKGIIHRDLKPDNFLFGINEKTEKLYLIDYGICKRYTKDNGEHIVMKQTNNIIGSFNYCSINSHNLFELSRRDDLESLMYVLIFISTKELIWENIRNVDNIKKKKELLTNNILIPGIIDNLILILKYIKQLAFEEIPDYKFIETLLKKDINNI